MTVPAQELGGFCAARVGVFSGRESAGADPGALQRTAPSPTREAKHTPAQAAQTTTRHFISRCGNHNVNPGQYVTTARNPSMVSSQGSTATVSSLMPILVMPEAT